MKAIKEPSEMTIRYKIVHIALYKAFDFFFGLAAAEMNYGISRKIVTQKVIVG